MSRLDSILWPAGSQAAPTVDAQTVRDLNLEDIFTIVTRGDPTLARHVRAPVADLDTVTFRQEIFRDLGRAELRELFEEFAMRLRIVHAFATASAEQHHRTTGHRLYLDAVVGYGSALRALSAALSTVPGTSRGLRSWQSYLETYLATNQFEELMAVATRVQAGLDAVRYTLSIDGRQVVVARDDNAQDYSATVEQAFAPLVRGFRPEPAPPEILSTTVHYMEEQIADRVAELFPAEFAELARFCAAHPHFLAPSVESFYQELRFYLSFLEFVDHLTGEGFTFSCPRLTERFEEIAVTGGYDLALAVRLRGSGQSVVPNDFRLGGSERVLVVTGPNQGGKSTFARMFGQLAYLAALGCPVPAASATLLLADRLSTHFERAESVEHSAGKLHDELTEVHGAIHACTARSLIIMNETFSSTTTADALQIGGAVLRRIIERGAVAVYVTFLDELASLHPAVVSMVAGVGDDPSTRTFRIVRRPADGKAHAAAIADLFGLGYTAIAERIAR
ncbi:MutS-related protein [Nocardia brasiliensis]|uniref:MutS-related protein n=1 Tax=Nocardia brasiliensis TaxID=37326 RepID=UPI00059FE81B|nr:hypothetical protein [Nocardia brasiliensis]